MKQKTALCYSEVFKRKVVKEIEDGVLTISQARTIYNIGGSSTLKRWINEYGINDRIGRTVHVMSKTEETENILLKREVKMLKQALEQKIDFEEKVISKIMGIRLWYLRVGV